MASVKSMLAAGLLAAPCADAFVAPGVSQVQVQGATLRGSAGVQSESSFGPKSALVAASAGAVALSFIGAQRPVARKQKVVCNFSKESQIGAMDPLGYFDPLDLCKDEATFKDFRAKEIKHGRLAMMGALGMLTQSLVQLPGFEGVPKDVSACTVGAGQTGFLITIAIIAVLEATVFVQDDSKERVQGLGFRVYRFEACHGIHPARRLSNMWKARSREISVTPCRWWVTTTRTR